MFVPINNVPISNFGNKVDHNSSPISPRQYSQQLNHRPQSQDRERSGHVRVQQLFRPSFQSSAQIRNQLVEKVEEDSSTQSRAKYG
ncbi:unnamed protein product [Ceratitis capitata]|uniref:(Mediterranean fruit fly) hypothetical protein n=1 Tax=Ceratitis capitata TaxID=7213 RepID=A0A811UUW2_CERCA|nr:unnamed protein product [Ceratitis capitata]